jgi:hypothetical protein
MARELRIDRRKVKQIIERIAQRSARIEDAAALPPEWRQGLYILVLSDVRRSSFMSQRKAGMNWLNRICGRHRQTKEQLSIFFRAYVILPCQTILNART